MSNKLSIKDIKAYLAQDLALIEAARLESLALDERKGVQAALKQFEKRKLKHAQIQQEIERLREKEVRLRQEGYQWIAGIDEVGRGPLAGPVVAGAVILPDNLTHAYFNDSKQLSAKQRQNLVADIEKYAISYAIAGQSAEAIDQYNILQATKRAMCLACERLEQRPDYLLIDAVSLTQELTIPQEAIIKGDATVYSIAAASIYAKEKRDQLMMKYAERYPGYGFEKNAGYGTKQHLDALEKWGPTPIHRKSFAPVKQYL